jgi:uncharacterized membrane protein YkgB
LQLWERSTRHGTKPALSRFRYGIAMEARSGVTDRLPETQRNASMLGTILLIVLVLLLIGALPNWGHSRNWGYGPSGGLGLVVVILLILVLMGRI